MGLSHKLAFLRMLSNAVLSQALLSAGNFFVGLLLIRRTAPEQYGYYVLIVTAVLLLSGLQAAFIAPSLVRCLTVADLEGRRDFVGGALRMQRQRLLMLVAAFAAVMAPLWYFDVVRGPIALIVLAAIAAALMTLYREYFRMVLQAYRLPSQALKVDIIYVAALCSGAYLATLTSAPAMSAALGLSFAAAVGGWLLSRMVWYHEGWNIHGSPNVLHEIAPVGTWALAGAAIHWTFSQGYLYLVASMLGVSAVATVSATRLIMMPVNLMASGIGSMTFPTVSKWLQEHPVRVVFHRLSWLAMGIAGLALSYFTVMWFGRDWIFTYVIKGHFEHRDTLLLMWGAVFLLMAVRDQMLFLPAGRGQWRIMAWLTLVTAVFSLAIGYVGMRMFGVVGALVGVLAGEGFNILGFLALSLREVRLADHSLPSTGMPR
jgi:O-antigen/teichoic acid export membrane protein